MKNWQRFFFFFFDLAYDRVTRDVLWGGSEKKIRVPMVNMKIIQDVYEEARTNLKSVCMVRN